MMIVIEGWWQSWDKRRRILSQITSAAFTTRDGYHKLDLFARRQRAGHAVVTADKRYYAAMVDAVMAERAACAALAPAEVAAAILCRPRVPEWSESDHEPTRRISPSSSRGDAAAPGSAGEPPPSPADLSLSDSLDPHELEVLEMLAGTRPAKWGSWVGECLEALAGRGLVTSGSKPEVTRKGLDTLSRIRRAAVEKELGYR